DVPRLTDFHCGVQHEVVARLTGDRDGTAGSLPGRIEGPHIRPHQTCPPLCFVSGGDAKLSERGDDLRVGASDFSNDGRLHQASLEAEVDATSSLLMRG